MSTATHHTLNLADRVTVSDSSSADTTLAIPLTAHGFVIVPDGSDITATIASAGFLRAS